MNAMTAMAPPEDNIVPALNPADLLRPAAFRHAVGRLEVRETNISWIVLTGSYAYKIKKRVDLGFIDTSTLSKRQHLCEEELRLNRRLAPDLYVDVVAITRDGMGVQVGGHGEIIEYAVRMKQFDASEELSALLERGAVNAGEIADLAADIAAFHASASRAPAGPDCLYTQQLHDAVLGNMAILLAHLDADTQLPDMGALIDWTHDYLHNSLNQLRQREQSGFIRECHGDLHARNLVRWRGRLTPFDCLEFDPKLRWIDVMNDVAFLVMDLMAHGRSDLAFTFLNSYLEHTGDYDGVRLLPFYAVYRALVRAMVDSIGAERDLTRREELCLRLRMRVKTAAAFISAPSPTLIIMHGPSGSGKSFLSERLAFQLGAVRIRSDLERKRLAGRQADAVGAAGFMHDIYTPEFSNRIYAHLLSCAQSCLRGGVSVIVDAAFLNGGDRRLFDELAAQLGARFVIVSCNADRQIMAERIKARQQARIDPSDANVGVLDRQLQNIQPLRPDEMLHTVTSDTSQPFAYEKTLAATQEHLARATASASTTTMKATARPSRPLQ
jgi:aminoglycoside phosphotransferase family enzyme/predicted kinase